MKADGWRHLGFVIALIVALLPVTGWAAACVRPGDILDVPTRGYLRDETPDLTLDFQNGPSLPVAPLSMTNSRLRILLPGHGMPFAARFKVRHHPERGPAKVVANGMTCADGPTDPTDPTDPGGSDSGSGAGANALERRNARLPFERATASDVAAPSGAPEYLLAGPPREVDRAEAVLLRLGVDILRRTRLDRMGLSFLALDLGGVVRPAQVRSALARDGIRAVVDRHSVYRAAQAATDPVQALVGPLDMAGCRMHSAVRVGIIDGPIDTGNPGLANVAIRITSVLGEREKQGSTDHATGIAALIAGTGTERVPSGVAPGAQIFSVVAFARNGGKDVARLENIAEALEWLMASRVGLVNMSLAGPRNETLAEVVRVADEAGMVLVAAAGNGGRPEVAYPASDPRVIAVTAVDANRRVYRKANYGEGIGFSAPGVDVSVPTSAGGLAHRSGTSYAAAIATAVIARLMAQGIQGRAGVEAALQDTATDLGPAGYDERYGWGLIAAPKCN